jgi:Ni/Fe-hydrogenase subunit HybB-like protein
VSAKYNLVCDQATTFNFQFQILENNTPLNLTGYTGTMTVRPFVGATTTTVVASTANGYMVFDATNGRITVTLSATVTGAISAGRYSYDLVITSGVTVTRILEGKFIVTGAVTT